nr:PREDICTED: uncharacterized protein LOC106703964 [Latimeria chalumnae]|eukprot:XP_014345435.1 PREDICTED: uncharacterized protein LOC106703964 [Latimeria chalumnae]
MVLEKSVRDLLFTDDCALVAHTQDNLQVIMDHFAKACCHCGLTMNLKKIEVMYQPASGKPYQPPRITIDGSLISLIDKFTYLGSTLSCNTQVDDEVAHRISKASSAFGKSRGKIWDKRGIKLQTKLRVHRGAVITSLLYTCETWTTYYHHIKQLNHFHLGCLRKIVKIKWQDKIPDIELLK